MTLIRDTYWGRLPFDFARAPRAHVEPVTLRSHDHRVLRGLYWAPDAPSRAALVMHPRVDFTRHYTIPRLCDAGVAVLALNSRSPNDDTDTVHEELLFDVAAGVAWLRERVEHVTLLGNSGGGSLMALYAAEADRKSTRLNSSH